MILIKDGVVFKALKPGMYRIAPIIDRIFGYYGLDAVITSGNDGKHKDGSLHGKDLAWDLRSHHIPTADVKWKIFNNLKVELGKDYDLLFENQGMANEHFHIEFQPRKEGK